VSLRAVWRAVALGILLVAAIVRFCLMRLKGPLTLERRALWVQASCIAILHGLGIRSRVEGRPPERGLIVANHLSYLDVLILSAATPCFFVAKAEIDRWPVFGQLARAGGTMFVDRSSRASAERVTAEVEERLKGTVPVLFFPEGTSTDGSQLLRFHSRLFTPAVEAGIPVTAASLRYVPEDGSAERELCWFGDDVFLPHLWKSLRGPNFCAEVQFGEPHVYTHRRIAADETQAEIAAMRAASSSDQDSDEDNDQDRKALQAV